MKKVERNKYRKKVNANHKAFAFHLYNCPKEPVSTFVNTLNDCLFNEEYRTILESEKEYYYYYYHPDHLGSSSWITDPEGRPVQHIQYLPFGETWADQRSANWNAPYTFSGKEKDWETSYHYYGARYYDSDLSIWLSIDPLASKYPNLSPYVYCMNNPVKLIDPDGREIVIRGADGNATIYTQGMKYDGKDKFTQQAIRALNKLSNGRSKTATSMVNELSESDNKFTIKSGSNQFYSSDANAYAMIDPYGTENNAYIANTGGGGEISWNPKGTLQMTSNGMRKNATMDLAHELAHGLDANQGLLTGSTVRTSDGKIVDIGLIEYRACYQANIIRREMGKSYQTRYGGDYSFDGYNYNYQGGGFDVVKRGKLILPQHFIRR